MKKLKMHSPNLTDENIAKLAELFPNCVTEKMGAKEMGTAESAKKELTEILSRHGFETVKPVNIIKRLVFILLKV